jgi:CheY-like chemotaxis protein
MRALLATRFELADIDEAADGAEAIRRVQEFKPDAVLMDILMPQMDGLESTRLIKALYPQVHVIALSMYAQYRAAAFAAGAETFVGKEEAPERLLGILEAMMRSTWKGGDDGQAL